MMQLSKLSKRISRHLSNFIQLNKVLPLKLIICICSQNHNLFLYFFESELNHLEKLKQTYLLYVYNDSGF